MSAGNINPNIPSYTAQKATETPSAVITDTSSFIAPAPQNVASAPVAPVSPIATPDAPSSLFGDVTPAPTMPIDSTIDTTSNPVVLSEAPVSPITTISETIATPAVSTQESLTTPTTTIITNSAQVMAPTTPEQNIPLVSEVPETHTESIFDLTDETEETPAITQDSKVYSEEKPEEKTEESLPTLSSENIFGATTSSVESTVDFIEMSLTRLAAMKKTLSDRKQSFLDKAEEYRAEKEKFAKLEEQAMNDSHSMDDEKDRIETMERYFEKQKKGASVTDSVNTGLTGIAVKNAVDNTMEKKPTRKTTHAKQTA